MSRRAVRLYLCCLASMGCLAGCGSDGGIPDSAPTKPVGEPLVFRLTGYEHAVSNSSARYMIVFKLNRSPTVLRKFSVDGGTVAAHGDFGVEGFAVGETGDVSKVSGDNCFAGVVESSVPAHPDEQVRRLNRIALGGRVEVDLRPLTPSNTNGHLVAGKKYVFHPRMRTASHGLSIGAIDRRDRKQLNMIQCG